MGLKHTALESTSISHLWSLGFGTITSESLVSLHFSPNELTLTIIVANLPQLVLSFRYLTYNGLFTCMLLVDEWNDYAISRELLRVTQPAGDQRSTYRLQLPYKYGIPWIVLSGLLHWLVSQSIFLARVTVFPDGPRLMHGERPPENTYDSISTCEYSSIAIISTIILGFLVVMLGIANGFRKYKPGMPLARSCSAAISAVCHPPEADVYPSTKKIMWGVVEHADNQVKPQAFGHCSLTSTNVSPHVRGSLYAGTKRKRRIENWAIVPPSQKRSCVRKS